VRRVATVLVGRWIPLAVWLVIGPVSQPHVLGPALADAGGGGGAAVTRCLRFAFAT
jgi:hypothetical protein